MMMKEKAIRDQIAEKFTLEMKTVEMNCVRKIKEVENEQIHVITKLKELLERKAQEVDTMKDFIISEREKVTHILESKENEISTLIKEHNVLQKNCQRANEVLREWKEKAERLENKLLNLNSLEQTSKDLKPKLAVTHEKMIEWQKKANDLQLKFEQTKAKLVKSEQNYQNIQMELMMVQEKYKNAKKTVFAYKVIGMPIMSKFSVIFISFKYTLFFIFK